MSFAQRLRNVTLRRICLLCEAIAHLGVARTALWVLPYRLYEKLLKPGKNSPLSNNLAAVKEVGWSVRRAAELVPWRSDCLIQATAARWMLHRRQIGTRLHLGVTAGGSPFSAHAWLTHDAYIVTGREGHSRFHTIQTY